MFWYSLDFHNTFDALLLFHSILETREACFRPLSGFIIPRVKMLNGGGYTGIAVSLCQSLRVSQCLPGFVQKISSEQLNLLYPDLMWPELYLLASPFKKNKKNQSNYQNFFKLKEVWITTVYITAIQFISIHILLFKTQEYSFIFCKHRKFKLWPQAK